MPDSEWERAQDTFVPGQLDNDKTAETKLTNLLRHFENKLNLVDPDSKLRGRVKPVTSVGQVAGKAPQNCRTVPRSGRNKTLKAHQRSSQPTMITQDEQNRLSFEQSKAEWDAYQKDKAEFEAYQKEVAGGVRFAPAVPNAVSPRCGCGPVVGGVAGGALTAQTGGWGRFLVR